MPAYWARSAGITCEGSARHSGAPSAAATNPEQIMVPGTPKFTGTPVSKDTETLVSVSFANRRSRASAHRTKSSASWRCQSVRLLWTTWNSMS